MQAIKTMPTTLPRVLDSGVKWLRGHARSTSMKARAYRWATNAAMLAVFLEALGAGKKW